MRRLALFALAAALGVVATSSAAAEVAQPAARSWIDAPLNGSVVTAGPLEVIAHATDADGVVELRLDVDRVEVETAAPDAVGATFVIARFFWTPTTDGIHRIDVSARDRSGEWGASGTTRVVVQLGTDTASTTITDSTTTIPPSTTIRPPTTTSPTGTAGPQPTPPPTTIAVSTTTVAPTPATSTTTVAPTTTVCEVGTPAPSGVSRTDTLNPILSWGYRDCREPGGFEVQVSRDAGFARVEQAATVPGNARTWTAGPLTDCITYHWRIRTSEGGPWVGGGSFSIRASRDCP